MTSYICSTSFQISQDLPTHIILAVIVIFPTGISTLYLYVLSHRFFFIFPTGISTLHLYFLSHRFYCHYSDRNIYTISLPLISSVLLSLFRQEYLHYISTSYLIGFIVIFSTGISTLHLYFLSHRFYCHYFDRNLYTISLPLISSVLSSRITSYLIRAIIFPYYVSCRILTFPTDVIILYHMPYQILITCTGRSLSSNPGIT